MPPQDVGQTVIINYRLYPWALRRVVEISNYGIECLAVLTPETVTHVLFNLTRLILSFLMVFLSPGIQLSIRLIRFSADEF